MTAKALDRILQTTEYLKSEHEKIDTYHTTCMHDEAPLMAWRETVKEKIDTLEDHLKEIKKQLLFK